MQQQTNPYTDRFIREPERHHITGLSRTTWWRLEQEGAVPRRRKLSPNTVGWRLSEILDWQDQREVGDDWQQIGDVAARVMARVPKSDQ